MSLPPDRLEPFELLKLMHAQRLDLSHQQIGALLSEVERLRGALVKAHKYAGCAYEPGEHPDATDEHQGCSICAVLQ